MVAMVGSYGVYSRAELGVYCRGVRTDAVSCPGARYAERI